MRPLTSTAVIITLLLATAASAQPQSSPRGAKEPGGSISGRVTRDGKGVPGVVVGLRMLDFSSSRSPLIKATTSRDGRFRLTGVAAGRYSLAALAPAFVSENGFGFGSSNVNVILAEGEAVEGI